MTPLGFLAANSRPSQTETKTTRDSLYHTRRGLDCQVKILLARQDLISCLSACQSVLLDNDLLVLSTEADIYIIYERVSQ